MQGKYKNWLHFTAAFGKRELLRRRLRNLVEWPEGSALEPGCTAIIGMCHRLPGVLLGNLHCLLAAAWPELRHVIIVVDGARGCVAAELEAQAKALSTPAVPIDIHYYSAHQAELTESLRLPWVFSWLSWSIAWSHCRTRHALIHDYDALVFGDTLQQRYDRFAADDAAIQGIRWYSGNGVETSDRLATTFEAFVDVRWIRSRPPIAGFHKITYRGGVSRDYDTLLHLQHAHTPETRRTTMPMPAESLVHPSQMIHQYTMARRFPGAAQECASLPMIPFFDFLSGDDGAIEKAAKQLEAAANGVSDLLGDGTPVNLSRLQIPQVDWDLKQMVQACMLRGIEPFPALYRYGTRLYEACSASSDATWIGDFTPAQRDWIERCRTRSEH